MKIWKHFWLNLVFNYLSEFLRCKLMRNMLCAIFRTVTLIFIVIICNTTFWPLYPPAFFRYPLFIRVWKWFNPGNHFFKMWQLVKQGVQEIWSCYSNNDVIGSHAFQPRSISKCFSRTVIRWIWNAKSNGISYFCSRMRGNRKVRYDWPYMERKGKLSTIVG